MKQGRKAPRSRTGCKRCKERRFKCDEEKPACGRCQAAGLTCPGYSQSLKWSTKHEVFDPTQKARTRSRKLSLGTRNPQNIDATYIAGSLESSSAAVLGAVPIPGTNNLNQLPISVQPDSINGDDATYRSESLPETVIPFDSFPVEVPGLPETLPFYSGPGDFAEVSEVEEVIPHDPFVLPTIMQMDFPPEQPVIRRHQLSILPSPTRGPSDFSSALVEYYFKETAGVFSCYDSTLNPFRTRVGEFWTLSPALYRTLQSMAAACLVNESPYFKRISRTLRTEAMSLLFNNPNEDEMSLLALLMLGQTSSWFDPQDLGIPLFKTLKSRLKSQETSIEPHSMSIVGDQGFFQEALEYWEMLLSFVSSEIMTEPVDGPWPSDFTHTRKVPHPWTGICRETQMLVNQVGQLVRSERIRARSSKFTWQHSVDESMASLQLARYLESRLKCLSEPQDDAIVNPGDVETPVWHLQRIAEIYRRTGLINLYRVFPDLLLQQISENETANANSTMLSGESSASDDWLGLVEGRSSSNEESESMYTWLTNFAIETVELLESIPASSRTRCLQPFMLVACGSELRAPPMENDPPQSRTSNNMPMLNQDIDFSWLSSPQTSFSDPFAFSSSNFDSHTTVENSLEVDESSLRQAFRVFHARKFVRGRLNLFMNVLPPRPTKTCLDLVEAVWSRLDDGEEDVYWVDVMMDMGLHTTMG